MKIVALSHCLLLSALLTVSMQISLPLFGFWKQRWALLRIARYASFACCLFLLTAFFCLITAFLNDNFTLAYVAQNSHSQLSWIYKICAVWSGHEGSMLLWVCLLSVWSAAACTDKQQTPKTYACLLVTLGFITLSFLLFLISVSNPFTPLNAITSDGRDLNPLLQDPGLSIHPPLLYLGYVGFSVVFAYGIVGLMQNRLDYDYLKRLRFWTLSAWSCLTFGIVAGSWWAYHVLGWGGWWFWDPVENAALLPWLTGTALLHTLSLAERHKRFLTWVFLLALLSFSFSLLGTFLVRSGILISVHAFAVDPERGVFLLGLCALLIGSALLLYALRIKTHIIPITESITPQYSLLLLNNLLLASLIFIVFLGTLYPLMIELFTIEKISVGAPYFNISTTPFFFLMFVFMGVAHLLDAQIDSYRIVKIIVSIVSSLILAIVLLQTLMHELKFMAVLGLSLALWILITSFTCIYRIYTTQGFFRNKQLAMLLAHIGVGITVIGIAISTYYSDEQTMRLSVGDHFNLGPYPLQFTSIQSIQSKHYQGIQAEFKVNTLNKTPTRLYPQLRYYPVADTAISKPAIDSNPWRDLYIALAQPLENNTWAVRAYYKPLISWIWCGGILIIIAALFAIWIKKTEARRCS